MSVINAKNVSIRYIISDSKDTGSKDYLLRRITHKYQVMEVWADRNITFSLERGDMLGVIGINGAGKSTLLRAISGIMAPTEGSIEVNGKITALLDLTTGFDYDLTLRENIYLRGALLGNTRQFMNERYDKIISFADLFDYQDRPFKHLSSEKKVKLAFSIAAQVNPDILILDEVLPVDDGAFREKIEKKMKETQQSGITCIFVSHNIEQVKELCNKILWLDHGHQVVFGDMVNDICYAYEVYLSVLPNAGSPSRAIMN